MCNRDQVHVHLPGVLLGEDDEQGFDNFLPFFASF